MNMKNCSARTRGLQTAISNFFRRDWKVWTFPKSVAGSVRAHVMKTLLFIFFRFNIRWHSRLCENPMPPRARRLNG